MKNIIYITLISFSLLAASCTKLDLVPTDTISPDKAFRNAGDINMGVIGVYALLGSTISNLSSMVSDEATFPVENNVGNNDAFRWLYTAANGSVTSFYAEGYQAIDRGNRVLAAIDKLSYTGTADEALITRYKGELLALRAYMHFELLRAYASAYENGALGIPYMVKSEIGFPARNSFEEVITKVKADISSAKTLIPANFTDKTRFTKTAATALQARVALYEKNWSEAISYATEVINAIPLATKIQFPGLWTDANDSEVSWKLKRVGTTDSRVGDFYYRQTGGIVLYAPSFKLINTLDTARDLRYTAYIRYDATRTGTKSKYLVKKFIGGSASEPGLTDIKIFRTAEMYLIRAEALAETTGDAVADLNTIGNARINNYTAVSYSSKAQIIDAIYKERLKELAFEGHRFFDLKRRNLNIERLPEDAANASGAVLLTPAQAQYNLPLPAQEIYVNKNTVQNPKY